MPNYPCSVWSKNVNKNHHAICCGICDQWVYVRCNLLDVKDYTEMKNYPNKISTVFHASTIICHSPNCPIWTITLL